MLKKTLSLSVIICFFLTTLGPLPKAQADSVLGLPAPGSMVNLSPAYEPVIIKGLTVHKDNPFLFDFIVDVGQDKISGEPLKKEGEKLIKYFLASLAIPDKDLWVNLSPYEKNKMVPEALGQTDMGRDLLEQDYILKQITASLIYPEKQLGRTFWDKVYAKSQEIYGTTQIPVNTFNKVWIMADRAEVFEHNQTAFVVDQHLKVMLEEDYLALNHHANSPVILSEAKDPNRINSFRDSSAEPALERSEGPQNDTHLLASQVVRQIILPELEKEVNTGKNFANLRQIFNSIILASWYKRNLKQALLNRFYADRSKVKGLEYKPSVILRSEATKDPNKLTPQNDVETIYQQYLKAYKKGVFNYIKEDVNTAGATIPRKYFSGGMDPAQALKPKVITDLAAGAQDMAQQSYNGEVDFTTLASTGPMDPTAPDAAMFAGFIKTLETVIASWPDSFTDEDVLKAYVPVLSGFFQGAKESPSEEELTEVVKEMSKNKNLLPFRFGPAKETLLARFRNLSSYGMNIEEIGRMLGSVENEVHLLRTKRALAGEKGIQFWGKLIDEMISKAPETEEWPNRNQRSFVIGLDDRNISVEISYLMPNLMSDEISGSVLHIDAGDGISHGIYTKDTDFMRKPWKEIAHRIKADFMGNPIAWTSDAAMTAELVKSVKVTIGGIAFTSSGEIQEIIKIYDILIEHLKQGSGFEWQSTYYVPSKIMGAFNAEYNRKNISHGSLLILKTLDISYETRYEIHLDDPREYRWLLRKFMEDRSEIQSRLEQTRTDAAMADVQGLKGHISYKMFIHLPVAEHISSLSVSYEDVRSQISDLKLIFKYYNSPLLGRERELNDIFLFYQGMTPGTFNQELLEKSVKERNIRAGILRLISKLGYYSGPAFLFCDRDGHRPVAGPWGFKLEGKFNKTKLRRSIEAWGRGLRRLEKELSAADRAQSTIGIPGPLKDLIAFSKVKSQNSDAAMTIELKDGLKNSTIIPLRRYELSARFNVWADGIGFVQDLIIERIGKNHKQIGWRISTNSSFKEYNLIKEYFFPTEDNEALNEPDPIPLDFSRRERLFITPSKTDDGPFTFQPARSDTVFYIIKSNAAMTTQEQADGFLDLIKRKEMIFSKRGEKENEIVIEDNHSDFHFMDPKNRVELNNYGIKKVTPYKDPYGFVILEFEPQVFQLLPETFRYLPGSGANEAMTSVSITAGLTKLLKSKPIIFSLAPGKLGVEMEISLTGKGSKNIYLSVNHNYQLMVSNDLFPFTRTVPVAQGEDYPVALDGEKAVNIHWDGKKVEVKNIYIDSTDISVLRRVFFPTNDSERLKVIVSDGKNEAETILDKEFWNSRGGQLKVGDAIIFLSPVAGNRHVWVHAYGQNRTKELTVKLADTAMTAGVTYESLPKKLPNMIDGTKEAAAKSIGRAEFNVIIREGTMSLWRRTFLPYKATQDVKEATLDRINMVPNIRRYRFNLINGKEYGHGFSGNDLIIELIRPNPAMVSDDSENGPDKLIGKIVYDDLGGPSAVVSIKDGMAELRGEEGATDRRSIEWVRERLADQAMNGKKPESSQVVTNNPWQRGGIDLNTSNGMQWKVSKDGQGVEMNIDPAMIARVKREGIDSLVPVVLRMTPVTSIWPLVGLQVPVPARTFGRESIFSKLDKDFEKVDVGASV